MIAVILAVMQVVMVAPILGAMAGSKALMELKTLEHKLTVENHLRRRYRA